MDDTMETMCSTALRCFLSIFVTFYIIWYFIGGYEKWDKYFEGKKINEKQLPVFVEDPTLKKK